jgi:hypothetical protein
MIPSTATIGHQLGRLLSHSMDPILMTKSLSEMKIYEQNLRDEPPPYTLVLTSGERVKVRSHDHIFLPPVEDENGKPLRDTQRSNLFQVWGNGYSFRWVSFRTISTIETRAPKK